VGGAEAERVDGARHSRPPESAMGRMVELGRDEGTAWRDRDELRKLAHRRGEPSA
jgi:hypothetical protein